MADSKANLTNMVGGASFIFVGTILSLIFSSLCRIFIGRTYSVEDYGTFTLCLTVVNLVTTFALLGFTDSLAREIPYYRSFKVSKINGLISLSLFIMAVSGMLFAVGMYLFSDFFANTFNNPDLSVYIRILSFSIPFCVMIRIVITICRGLGSSKEQVLFQNILQNVLFLLSLICAIVLGWSFDFTFFGYLLAQIITAAILVIYLYNRRSFRIDLRCDTKILMDMLTLSLPLLFTSISFYLATWTDSLMIGYYMSSQYVGYYNVAFMFAQLIPVILTSAAFLYLPLASELYDQNQLEHFKQAFHTLSKWIILFTFPYFCILLIYPEIIIGFFFGADYLPAAQTMQVLTIGYFIYVIFGLSNWNIMILKQSKFILFVNVILTSVNILMNLALIPTYGIYGAAFASLFFYASIGVFYSIRCYRMIGVHVFDKNYVSIVIQSIFILFLVAMLPYELTQIYALAAFGAILFAISATLAMITKSINEDDFVLIRTLLGSIFR